MPTFKDLTGQKFDRLDVISRAHTDSRGHIHWLCKCNCGKEKIISVCNLRNGTTRSCGCLNDELKRARSGPNNPLWRSGKYRNGECIMKWSREHPYANNKGYVLEHRLIMESHLGRYLSPDETVHHKNGIKSDNRIENLELRVGAHGVGQCLKDRLKEAMALLEQYPDEAQVICFEKGRGIR